MEHDIQQSTVNIAERDFMEFKQRGDDFFKIELFRPAKSWYTKALAFNMQTEKLQNLITECDKLLTFERKVRRNLLVIAAAILLVYFIFLN